MEKLIINADDFGLNSSVNRAIVDLFTNGLINSATLMANMPAFDEAISLVHKYNLAPKIGLHLVLTEGTPLTEEIKKIPFLFNGKKDYKKNKYQLFFPNKKLKDLFYIFRTGAIVFFEYLSIDRDIFFKYKIIF